jgi:hypothetical protein
MKADEYFSTQYVTGLTSYMESAGSDIDLSSARFTD